MYFDSLIMPINWCYQYAWRFGPRICGKLHYLSQMCSAFSLLNDTLTRDVCFLSTMNKSLVYVARI